MKTYTYAYLHIYLLMSILIYIYIYIGLVALGPLSAQGSQGKKFKDENVDRIYIYITSMNTFMRTYAYIYIYI